MGNETLQKLAHDYAVGAITQYEYRVRRTALIDDITGYCEKPADAASGTASPTGGNVAAGITAASGDNLKRYKLFVLVIVTIAIIIFAVQHDNELQKPHTTSGENQTLPLDPLNA